MITLLNSSTFASYGEEIVKKYKGFYDEGKYELAIKELFLALDSGKISGDLMGEAVDIIADSYFSLDQYTQANQYYFLSSHYPTTHGEYVYKLFEKISIEKGYIVEEGGWENIHERSKHYGGMFVNPSHDRTLYALISKIFDDDTIQEKRQYFKEMALRDENDDWVTKLTEFYAGDISLEELWIEVSEDNIVTISTYAGLLLEFTGRLEEARELYNKALNKTVSKNVEKLLAANRLGLFSLERYLENCVSSIETR